MPNTEWIVAGLILLVAGVALAWYMRDRQKTAERRAELQKKIGPIEHVECDVYRNTIVEKSSELASTRNDPLKEGNLRGEIAKATALRDECERQATRREAFQ